MKHLVFLLKGLRRSASLGPGIRPAEDQFIVVVDQSFSWTPPNSTNGRDRDFSVWRFDLAAHRTSGS